MNKRKLIISLAGFGILAVSFLLAGQLKREAPDRSIAPGSIATAVASMNIAPGEVLRFVKITGRLFPQSSVSLYAEVGGVAEFGPKPFKPGLRFSKGELLLKINAEEMESSLASARSAYQSQLAGVIPDLKIDFADEADAWTSYLENLRIDQMLPALPQVKDQKLNLFLSGRNIYTGFYNIKEAETRLAKHVLRAPFNGSLTVAQLDASALVRTGQALGEFISTGYYELEAGVSYQDIGALSIGSSFEMRDVNTGHSYTARVVRINDAVDPLTQQVKVYAEVISENARSGIYLEGEVAAQTFAEAVEIPAQALVDERAVFVVRDSTATLVPVEALYKTAEKAIVSGISQKEMLITSKHNEAFAGSKVSITNTAE
jgi:multidrug efflux pump subunit AcrA (membrane-fusion protein)